MPTKKYTDEQWAQVDDLLGKGASVTESADSTGIPRGSIYQRLRKSADPTPGGNKPRTKRSIKESEPVTDEQLERMLRKVAAAPTVPARIFLHCNYCADHFASTAPQVAADMVALANEYPWLREQLADIQKYMARAAVGGMLAAWIGVPIAHHMISPEMFQWVAMWLELPIPDPNNPTARPQRPVHDHTHDEPYDYRVADAAVEADHAAREPEPVVTGFEGMDIDSLMLMARQQGITVEQPPETIDVEPVESEGVTTNGQPSPEAVDAALAALAAAAETTDPNEIEAPPADPDSGE